MGGREVEVRLAALTVRSQKVRARYSVVLAAQASCVDHSVVRAVPVNCAARSWPRAERGSEGNENENESVRASVV